MLPPTYRIREFVEGDFEADARITNHLFPDHPTTADEMRHFRDVLRDPRIFSALFAVDQVSSGEVVATGGLFNAPWAYDPDRYWVSMGVEPEHHGRGVGQGLYDRMESVARARRAKGLWATVRVDQPAAVRFFLRNGFVETRRNWTSRLDLDEHAPAPPVRSDTEWARDGIVFTTLAEEGSDRREVRDRVIDLHREASRDTPRMGPATDFSYDEETELLFRPPGFLPEGFFLARHGETYVAMSEMVTHVRRPERLFVNFTGTRPAFRNRGIASELKRRSAEYARGRGYRYLETSNDSDNPAIWAINQLMGFRRLHEWIQGEKRLDSSKA